ncbi:MAG: hypothetical protein ACOYNM_18580 [Gemmataceae bacterium]
MLHNKIQTSFLLLTFLMLLGCGPDGPILKPVEGTITYNGKKSRMDPLFLYLWATFHLPWESSTLMVPTK